MHIENDPNELLDDALCEQDIEAVRAALDANAHPDDIVGDDATPLWWSRMTMRVITRRVEDEAKFQNDAWDLMVPLVRVTDYRLPDLRFADCPDLAPTKHIGSTILLKALLEDPDFRLNLDVIFASTSNAADFMGSLFKSRAATNNNPEDESRRELRTELLAIHRQVGLRLANPFSPFEMEVANSLSESAKSYWIKEMKFPSLTELPMPSDAYVQSQRQAIQSLAKGQDTLQRVLKQGWVSENDKKVIMTATTDVRLTLQSNDQMRRARRPWKPRKSPSLDDPQ